jgi:hypothetical protein
MDANEIMRMVGQFLVKQRFWLLLGLACIFAFCISSGTNVLKNKIENQKKQLDNSYSAVSQYQNGDKANSKWKEAVEEKKGGIKSKYDVAAEQLYLEQEKLMTWPTPQLQQQFGGRPFGAKLDDNQNEFLFAYTKAHESQRQRAEVFWDLYVLDKNDDGSVIGLVDANLSLIEDSHFPRDPNSLEAWLTQERVWIQRAIVKAIRQINKPTEDQYAKSKEPEKGWLYAPVKKVVAIRIGEAAIDQQANVAQKALVEYAAADASAPAASSESTMNINAKRYLEKTEQYRIVPVSVHMVVDQEKVTPILGILSNADFHFVVREVRQSHTEQRLELPVKLKDKGIVTGGRSATNPLYNWVNLDVYGIMRFYEMPASLKEKREQKLKDGGAPADAAKTAAEAGKTAEPAKADPSKSETKSEAPKAADPAKADPPKAIDPAKTETPKTDSGKTDAGKSPAPKGDAKGGGKAETPTPPKAEPKQN